MPLCALGKKFVFHDALLATLGLTYIAAFIYSSRVSGGAPLSLGPPYLNLLSLRLHTEIQTGLTLNMP